MRGLSPQAVRVETPTFPLGRTRTPLDRTLQLAGDLENEAPAARRELGK